MSDKARDYSWGFWKPDIDFFLPLGLWTATVSLGMSVRMHLVIAQWKH